MLSLLFGPQDVDSKDEPEKDDKPPVLIAHTQLLSSMSDSDHPPAPPCLQKRGRPKRVKRTVSQVPSASSSDEAPSPPRRPPRTPPAPASSSPSHSEDEMFVRRNSISPRLSAHAELKRRPPPAVDLPGKKKRGRKRQSKPPEYSDSEEEEETRPSFSKARPRPSVTLSESGDTWKRNKSDSESSVDRGIVKKPMTSYRSSSEDSVKIEDSPPKLDVESVPKQDKKKSDTLRAIWVGKGGGKDKGGKGKAGGGVIIVEQRSPAPTCTPAISERVPSPADIKPTPTPTHIPTIEYTPGGRPILMCSISLSKLPHIPSPSKSRSEEMRIKTELADTRQDDKMDSKERKSKHRKPGPASLTNGNAG